MEIPRFLRRGRCVKPIIAEETGRGKRFFDGGAVFRSGGSAGRDKRIVSLSVILSAVFLFELLSARSAGIIAGQNSVLPEANAGIRFVAPYPNA